MMRPRLLGPLLAFGLVCSGSVFAQVAVDTALVLAVDASGSIDEGEYRLQKDGIAAAITDKRVLEAIGAGANRRIAIAYVEWGSPAAAHTAVPWMTISDEASAMAFVAALMAAPRSSQSYNAIGDAIDHGVALLQACPCKPRRMVIDISGDNRDMRSLRPAPMARDAAVAAKVTINALAVLEDRTLGPSGRPALVEYFERDVIGGFGAFVIAAQERADFTRAMRQKMILEIAGRTPDGGSRVVMLDR
jgi:hypothetical protein